MAILETGLAALGGVKAVKGLFENKDKQNKKADQRQIDQQIKLNQVNNKNAKDLADYENELRLKMWKDTNYTAQLAEAEKAGISKAHAIGGGGAGVGMGASVGTGGGGAASGGAENQAAENQTRLMDAQINNMNAQTAKMAAETENIAGVERENKKADTTLKDVQIQFDKIRNEIQGETQEAQAQRIFEETKKIASERWISTYKEKVDEATQQERIDIVKGEAQLVLIEQMAKNQGIELSKEQAKKLKADIEQGWKGLEIEEKGLDVSRENMAELTKTMLISAGIQATGNVINSLIDIKKMKVGKKGTTTTEKFGKGGKKIGKTVTNYR